MDNSGEAQVLCSLLDAPSNEELNGDDDEKEELEQLISLGWQDCLSSSFSSSSNESENGQQEHVKCSNFVGTIDAYSDEDFKSHMRLQRRTIEYLIARFSQSEFLSTASSGGRPRVGCRKTMLMYVWYISNTVTFRQLANLFGVTKSSVWMAVRRVSFWLISISHEFIKWPQGEAAEETRRKFKEKKGIPGVIGAIDCTHIIIKAPEVSKECYFDRKHSYSIVLQAVVDANKKFIDITCGEPGSFHDSRVLRRSDLYLRTQTNYIDLFPNNTFILGDSAYPATSWLVPPFKDHGNLTDAQRSFNYIHSSTRMVVEHSFGLLKSRFRRLLKFTEQTNLCTVTNIIVSACVLHNICITMDDEHMEILPEQTYESGPENPGVMNIANRTVNRRDVLFNYLQDNNII